MAKNKEDITPISKLAPVVEPEPKTGCVVCGSYEGELSGVAGHARWHAACEASRPDVIAKVRARA
jgi:hypothetical protein